MKCQKCGSTDIVVDSAQGVKICVGCGKIVESNAIVSELQFNNSKASGYFLNLKTG
jgi:transcription initiation factor TFIIIB Brf1 subunit/transcription initiation factor TFIIB